MEKKARWRIVLGVCCVSIFFARAAEAQVARQFEVTPRVGWMIFDNASALDDAPMLGIDATYFFGASGLGLGFYADIARPDTKGDYFTPIRLDFGPESELRFVGVRTTLVHTGLQAMYRFPVQGRVSPVVAAGLGLHRVYADPQQQQSFDAFTEFSFNFGGGLDLRVSERAGFRLEVRDFVYPNWEREKLNVLDPSVQDDRFPEQHGTPPSPECSTQSCSMHNIRLSLLFVFMPSAGQRSARSQEEENGDDELP